MAARLGGAPVLSGLLNGVHEQSQLVAQQEEEEGNERCSGGGGSGRRKSEEKVSEAKRQMLNAYAESNLSLPTRDIRSFSNIPGCGRGGARRGGCARVLSWRGKAGGKRARAGACERASAAAADSTNTFTHTFLIPLFIIRAR